MERGDGPGQQRDLPAPVFLSLIEHAALRLVLAERVIEAHILRCATKKRSRA